MIHAWLQREGLERDAVHIRFYSDHVSDHHVHHWADEAVAANAHSRLVRLAKAEGWEVLDWSSEPSPLPARGGAHAKRVRGEVCTSTRQDPHLASLRRASS